VVKLLPGSSELLSGYNPSMTIKGFIRTTIILFGALPTFAISDYLNCPCKVVKMTDGDTVYVLDQSRIKYKIRLGVLMHLRENTAENLRKWVRRSETDQGKRAGMMA
jgi:hypothetical protein